MFTCWGRADEIESILVPILDRAEHSAVILYGDSGIGKSTVLEEVRLRLGSLPGVILGFYKTPQTDPDPLLHVLDALLSQIYTVQHSLDQLRIAAEKSKAVLSLSNVKGFLLTVLKTMGESSGLGLFAKGVSEAAGWAKDNISLDASVPSTLLPKLGYEAFRDILKILITALPDQQFVFIIDNLSAPAESVTAGIRGFGSLDTVLSFMSLSYPETERVHLLFSWKRAPHTEPAFRALAGSWQEYGGELRHLKPITSGAALRQWLSSEFTWFAGLENSRQESVLKIAGGLPQVIAEWRRAKLLSFDSAELERRAADIRERRYGGWGQVLESAGREERRTLLCLALMGHAMPVSALAELSGQDSQACIDVLRIWTDRDLLQSQYLERQHLPVYTFEHENKRWVALRYLPATFPDGAQEVRQSAYEFALAHFNLAEFWPPRPDQPTSVYYLGDALELAEEGSLPARVRDVSVLRSVLEMAFVGYLRDSPDPSWWEAWQSWPHPFQAWILDFSITSPWLDADAGMVKLQQWLAVASRPVMSLGQAIAEAAALANLTARTAVRNRPDLFAQLFDNLQSFNRAYATSVPIAIECGRAAVNGILLFGSSRNEKGLDEMLKALSRLHNASPGEQTIAEVRARGLASAVQQFGAWIPERLESLLADVRLLQQRFSAAAAITAALADSLVVLTATFGHKGQMEQVEVTIDELDRLWRTQITQHHLLVNVAAGLVNAIGAYARMGDLVQAELSLERLQRLAGNSHAQDVAELLGAGIVNLLPAYEGSGSIREIRKLLDVLRTTRREFQDKASLAELLVDGLATASAEYLKAGDIDPLNTLLDEVLQVWRQFLSHQKVARYVAKALANGIGANGQLQRIGRVLELLLDARAIWNGFPDDYVIAEMVAIGLSNAIATFRTSQPDQAREFLGELTKIQQRHPEDSGLGALLARSLQNIVAGKVMNKRTEGLLEFINELKGLSSLFADDPMISVPRAEALAAAVQAFSGSDDGDAVADCLTQLRALDRAEPPEAIQPFLAEGLADGIGFYARHGNFDTTRELLQQIRGLQNAKSQSLIIAAHFARALIYSRPAYVVDSSALQAMSEEFETLRRRYPQLRFQVRSS